MADAVRDYFEGEAADYAGASDRGLWAWIRRRESRALMDILCPLPGERILDAGCGAGHYTAALLDAGVVPTAVDFSPAMVEQVRARLGVEAHVADLCDLDLPPVYDRVLCAGALEFVADPGRALRCLAGVLRPGGAGRVVILAPADGPAARLYRRFHRRHGFDLHLFTPTRLDGLARAAGLPWRVAWDTAGFNYAVGYSDQAPPA